jgi:hypothetical protein
MPTPTSSRSFTLTTLIAGVLALAALGLVGVAASDYLRIQGIRAEIRHDLDEAKVVLEQMTYDADGNVSSEDRSRYETAMMQMKSGTDGMRNVSEQEANLYPYVGAGVLGFLIFTIVAVRSTRRTAPRP